MIIPTPSDFAVYAVLILEHGGTAVYKQCDLIICPPGHQDVFILMLQLLIFAVWYFKHLPMTLCRLFSEFSAHLSHFLQLCSSQFRF